MASPTAARRAFTLIERLVVISIIAILIIDHPNRNGVMCQALCQLDGAGRSSTGGGL